MDIAGKTILITGANRGIGQALLREALNRGARRVYAGTRSTLPDTDPRVTPLKVDVTDEAAIERAASELPELDLLINNAGVAIRGELSDLGQLQRQFDVNALGPLRMTLAFLPLLIRSKGSIVNILSMTSIAAFPQLPGYSMSKAAALSLTQSLRALLAPKGVTVYGVIPGLVDTDMTRGFDITKDSPEAVAEAIFAGLERGEEEVFPDSTSRSFEDGWRSGVSKALERYINDHLMDNAQQPS